MILSITFVPAALALFVTGRLSEKENVLVRWRPARLSAGAAAGAARPGRHRRGAAAALLVVTGVMATRLGSEFLPSLDEGDLLVHALRIPGTSLSTAVEMQHALERKLKTYPEVDYVFSKIGTAEIATDPDAAERRRHLRDAEAAARTGPIPAGTKASLVAAARGRAAARCPGNNYEFTQPIQMRFNELIAGVRSDVAVKVFGDDMETLEDVGADVEARAGRGRRAPPTSRSSRRPACRC